MYTDRNFKSKKELKEAVAAWNAQAAIPDHTGEHGETNEFRRAVDTWEHTCEIVLAQVNPPQGGEQWDNRRVRS